MNGEIVERVRRSTVWLENGTGVIAGPEAVVVTNAHVARSTSAKVHLWDGRVVDARVVKRHARRDLAELRIDVAGLPALPLADSDTLRPGHLVVAVGNPLGFQGAASAGVVRAVGPVQGLGSQPWVQASVRLAPGNSGGPLANARGELVGINTMVLGRGGLGLAVPSRAVNEFLIKPAPPRLGVSVRSVRQGWLLLEVEAGTPAEQASLRAGDILVGPDGLDEAIERGGELRLQFLRGSRSPVREVTVRL